MAYRPGRSNGNGHGSYEFLEQQNDELVEGLSSKVSALKRVTIAIGEDVREQNRLIDDMESDFTSSLGVLGATMKRLGVVSRAGGKNVLCYLVAFAMFVFLVIYFMVK